MKAPAPNPTKRRLAVSVRPFLSHDLRAVLAIADEGWDWPRIKSKLDQQGVSFLVAAHRRWVVGFIVAQEVPGRIEVLHLAVVPFVRRQGVGSYLLACISGEAARLNKPVAATVREHDDPMIALLAQAGFKGDLRREFFKDGEDAIRFTLRFDNWR